MSDTNLKHYIMSPYSDASSQCGAHGGCWVSGAPRVKPKYTSQNLKSTNLAPSSLKVPQSYLEVQNHVNVNKYSISEVTTITRSVSPAPAGLGLLACHIREEINVIQSEIEHSAKSMHSQFANIKKEIEEIRETLKFVTTTYKPRPKLTRSCNIDTNVHQIPYEYYPYFIWIHPMAMPVSASAYPLQYDYSWYTIKYKSCESIENQYKYAVKNKFKTKCRQRNNYIAPKTKVRYHKCNKTKKPFKNLLKVHGIYKNKLISFLKINTRVTTSFSKLSNEYYTKYSKFNYCSKSIDNAHNYYIYDRSECHKINVKDAIDNFCTNNNDIINRLNKKCSLERKVGVMNAMQTFCVGNDIILSRLNARSTMVMDNTSPLSQNKSCSHLEVITENFSSENNILSKDRKDFFGLEKKEQHWNRTAPKPASTELNIMKKQYKGPNRPQQNSTYLVKVSSKKRIQKINYRSTSVTRNRNNLVPKSSHCRSNSKYVLLECKIMNLESTLYLLSKDFVLHTINMPFKCWRDDSLTNKEIKTLNYSTVFEETVVEDNHFIKCREDEIIKACLCNASANKNDAMVIAELITLDDTRRNHSNDHSVSAEIDKVVETSNISMRFDDCHQFSSSAIEKVSIDCFKDKSEFLTARLDNVTKKENLFTFNSFHFSMWQINCGSRRNSLWKFANNIAQKHSFKRTLNFCKNNNMFSMNLTFNINILYPTIGHVELKYKEGFKYVLRNYFRLQGGQTDFDGSLGKFSKIVLDSQHFDQYLFYLYEQMMQNKLHSLARSHKSHLKPIISPMLSNKVNIFLFVNGNVVRFFRKPFYNNFKENVL